MVRATDGSTRNKPHHNAKYDPDTVAHIVELRKQGLTHNRIAEIVGIHPSICCRLANRERYNEDCKLSHWHYRKRGYTPLWQGNKE